MGRTGASVVKELIQEQFCQPAINEGTYAEYFKQTYGRCPERILFVGQDRLVVNRIRHLKEFLLVDVPVDRAEEMAELVGIPLT